MSKAWPKGRAQRRARLFLWQLLNTRKALVTFHTQESGRMPPTITDLIPVPVHGHTLFVADDPVPLVPLRPICDVLALSWGTQFRKVTEHPTFAPTVVEMKTVGADGKLRKMASMPSDMVMGWLMTIHPDKVAPKLRDTLIAFQRTAARLLHDAWAAMRAGLPFVPAGRPQADLFDQAPMGAWLSHPTIQDAVLLRRQAQDMAQDAAAKARALRARGTAMVKRFGLRSADLDMLTRATRLPPPPASDDLPLLAGA